MALSLYPRKPFQTECHTSQYYDDAYNNANEEYRRADEAYKAGGGIPVAAALAAADSDSDSDSITYVQPANYIMDLTD